jgi:glycosyltransferase involved in cell wall biosynthesis
LRICYFGTYSDQEGYPMNRVLLQGLKEAGAEVIPCHARVWSDAADKMAGLRGLAAVGRGLRLGLAWVRLALRFVRLPDYDVLIVGYVGHLDVLLARFLSLFRRRPVVLNALVSLYDTAVLDRALVPERSARARLLHWLDRTAFRLADRVLIDTDTHGRHLAAAYGVPPERLIAVRVGADPTGLPETPPPPPPIGPENGPVTVLWFGTYIALHGVPTILQAARRLAGRDDMRFEMLGRGQELAAVRAQGDGPNVHFDARWVDRPALLRAIARSHVCLGVFGSGEKAGRVIPCKVYDALAMGRPVVTADTPAARELLTDGRDALLVPPGDPGALAEALAALADDPARRAALGAAGHATYLARCTPAAIGRDLLNALPAALGGGQGRGA